ncbi:hypothetical protein, partial [Salmonella enterica]|uniref:hypothetical protein n=1 Tax=Salmonella enterica TaxID=28901 RepID=UPI003D7672BF
MVIESVCGDKRDCGSGEIGAQDAPRGVYSAAVSPRSKGAVGPAPLSLSTTWPGLKIINVGRLRKPTP